MSQIFGHTIFNCTRFLFSPGACRKGSPQTHDIVSEIGVVRLATCLLAARRYIMNAMTVEAVKFKDNYLSLPDV